MTQVLRNEYQRTLERYDIAMGQTLLLTAVASSALADFPDNLPPALAEHYQELERDLESKHRQWLADQKAVQLLGEYNPARPDWEDEIREAVAGDRMKQLFFDIRWMLPISDWVGSIVGRAIPKRYGKTTSIRSV